MKHAAVLLVVLAAASQVHAQELSLFVPLAVDTEQRSPVGAVATMSGDPAPLPGFTLRSNSRFGDSYRSIVVDGSGNAIEVAWSPGQQAALPQHSGYTVVAVDSTQLTLQQPSGVACVPQDAVGVRCNEGGQMLLSLVTLSPLTSNGAQEAPGGNVDAGVMGPQPENVVVGPDGNAAFINPFAAAVMEAQGEEAAEAGRTDRARARAERLQQFQVERIPEDQVPPGMRLVRTPFGDRLVPVRQ